jgi:raffinose/stachyose/melibiose transport system permease protein
MTQSMKFRWVVLAALTALTLLVLAPLLVIALNAVKSPTDYANHGPLSVPTSLYFHGIVTSGTAWTSAGSSSTA